MRPSSLSPWQRNRATRKVLAHRVSINLANDFCFEVLEEAITKYETPEIFNSCQDSQFNARLLHRRTEAPRHLHLRPCESVTNICGLCAGLHYASGTPQ